MKKRFLAFGIIGATLLLGGCEGVDFFSAGSKNAPDEFTVFQRAPLTIPPDYGLRPPKPGAIRPQGLDPRGQARTAILGNEPVRSEPLGEGMSPGTRALLKQTGGDQADPDIRIHIAEETESLAKEEIGITDKILFWSETGEYGRVIDADKEERRIRENEALGRSPADPTIPDSELKPEIKRGS